MPANLEWAKRTFNVLALLTKNYNFFGTLLLGILLVSLFINRNVSLRIHTADIISLV